MSLETLQKAQSAILEAEKVLRSEAKSTIQEELKALFTDDTIQNVTWAQKAGEYNDEGMFPGVFGPALNEFDTTDPEEVEDQILDWSSEAGYDVLYGSATVDPRAKRLESVLNAIGDEILSDLFGDENVTVAVRTPNGATIVSESIGY